MKSTFDSSLPRAIRWFVVLFLPVVFASSARAQSLKAFPTEPKAFEEAFAKTFATLYGNKKAADQELIPFWAAWENQSPEFQEKWILLANGLVKKRATNLEPWQNYTEVFRAWCALEDEGVNDAWLEHSEELLKKAPLREYTDPFRHWKLIWYRGELYNDGNLVWRLAETPGAFGADPLPYVLLEGQQIRGRFKTDSTVVDAVNGKYYPTAHRLEVGSGALVSWTRAGFSPDSLYAELGSFVLDASKPGWTADTATLYSKMYLREPASGKFEERLSVRSEEERATFPRFEGFEDRLVLTDFFPGVDYTGGFSVMGRRFFASVRQGRAQFVFKYDQKPALRLRAPRFLITPEALSSEQSAVSFLFSGGDSLYHPKCEVRFDPETKEVRIRRPQVGLALVPFVDSYHGVDIYLDKIDWKTDQPSYFLGTLNLGTPAPMVVESRQYFRGDRFSSLQGLAAKNPLYLVDKIATSYNNSLSLKDMARSYGMGEQACEIFMMELAVMGFVRYDLERQWIDVEPKVREYILNDQAKRDYDVIQLVSEVATGMNAQVSLLTGDMDLVGIRELAVSDSQKVAFYPEKQRIILKKGLDFDFDGVVKAGRFTFHGRQFRFAYLPFELAMATIDSMKFAVESFEADTDGRRRLVQVRNTLQNINGRLQIDQPQNKSSTKRYTEYPIFTSGKRSYVYYDKPSTYGGVYYREKFNVEIAPFAIDSLDNTSTKGLKFDGVFTSAGIFPVMNQKIGVQRDYSLGFTAQTPASGWGAYGGKGTVIGEVSLSLKGLETKGDLVYVRTRSQAEPWVLFPDSTKGLALQSQLTLLAGSTSTGHPDMQGQKLQVQWYPYAATWKARTTRDSLLVYGKEKGWLRGQLVYRPDRLNADGVLGMHRSETQSREMALFAGGIKSNQADFRVRAADSGPWGFVLPNATANLDLIARKGSYVSNGGTSRMQFPINQYTSTLDRAVWDVVQETVALSKGTVGAQAEMISQHPQQDSLRFNASKAVFYLRPSVLKGEGVPHLDLADARVFPDSNRIVVEAQAYMRPLKNAKITAPRSEAYHHMERANLLVEGRNKFGGTATYLYRDVNDQVLPIVFSRVQSDSGGTTYGRGDLSKVKPFPISPYFQFYGEAKMFSSQEHLTFDGFTTITAQCPSVSSQYFRTTSVVDPSDIVLELPNRDTAKGLNRVFNGIYLAQDSAAPYAAFIGRGGARASVELIGAYGVLYYEPQFKHYVVTTRRRMEDPEAPDNVLTLNTETCVVEGTGQLRLGDNTGLLEMKTFGRIAADLRKSTMEADVALTLQFLFQPDVLKGLGAELASESFGDFLTEAAVELCNFSLDLKDRQEYYKEGVAGKLPRPMRTTLFLDQAHLTWDAGLRTFRSDGPLVLGGVDGTTLHREVEGILELRKKSRGDEFTLYVKTAAELEHFFLYRRNILQFYSTHKPYLDAILSTDPNKRSIPPKNGQSPFVYNTSTRGKMRLFLENQPVTVDDSDEATDQSGSAPSDSGDGN